MNCRWYTVITRTGATVRVWARDAIEAREISDQQVSRDWHAYCRDEPMDEAARRFA